MLSLLILRPVKKLAVMLGFMPKTTSGKKWLKRIVLGEMVEMLAEIGPQITQITRINGRPSAMRSAVVNELHGINKKAPQYHLPELRGRQTDAEQKIRELATDPHGLTQTFVQRYPLDKNSHPPEAKRYLAL